MVWIFRPQCSRSIMRIGQYYVRLGLLKSKGSFDPAAALEILPIYELLCHCQ